MATTPTKRSSASRNTTASSGKTPGAKTTTGTTKSKSPVRPAAKTTAPEPTLVTTTALVVAQADLKKKELIDLVVTRSGIKKKDAKPVVEAMLAVLGETIADGRELNLQPLGKLRINRSEEKSNGRVIVCKLRQSKSNSNAQAPLAKAGEES